MHRKQLLAVVSVLALVYVSQVRAGDPLPPAETWIPQEAVLVAQFPQPDVLIDRVFGQDVVQMVKSLPVYEQAMANGGTRQALTMVRYLEDKHKAKFPVLLKKLVGGGITLAVGPRESFVAIVDAEDAELLSDVHEFVRMLAKGEAEKAGNPDRVASADYRGVTGWKFGPKEVHAIIGRRLILSNQPEALKAVLDLRAEGEGGNLLKSAGYQAATAAVGKDAEVKFYADLSVLKQLPGFKQGMKQNDNPLSRLLFAPLLDAINDATWFAAGVNVDQNNLQIDFVVNGQATDASSFAVPQEAGQGAMPNLQVPRRIAALSFYRDMHRFYAAKDELFPERTSGLIFFENMMGIFFTGRDLTQEVLAETLPELRVVVAEQKFNETTGVPTPQFPGFAVVIRLRDPAKFAPVMEEAWQKAIGLVNFTRGQQALPGLIIDKAVQGDTKYTTARFSVADEENKNAVDVRFNFQPSLAIQGDHLILSSSDALTRDLIDALQKEAAGGVQPLSNTDSLATVSGEALASILDANREPLILQNMVEDGNTEEEATAQIGAILQVLKYLRDIHIDTGVQDGNSKMSIRVGYAIQ